MDRGTGVTVAFRVEEHTVTIARILYGGKSLGGPD